jgi:hypothetical protein
LFSWLIELWLQAAELRKENSSLLYLKIAGLNSARLPRQFSQSDLVTQTLIIPNYLMNGPARGLAFRKSTQE